MSILDIVIAFFVILVCVGIVVVTIGLACGIGIIEQCYIPTTVLLISL